MINSAITKLIQYGINAGLVDPRDKVYVTNAVLETLKLEEYEEVEVDGSDIDLEEVLTAICDYAVEAGLIEDSIVYKDLFDTKVMGRLVPPPSVVIDKFNALYAEDPNKATDYFYKLSQDTDYIRRYRIKKDQKWTADTEYGTLDITINLSKPEKDPKAIAAAKLAKQSGYPKCLLCVENEGYAGRVPGCAGRGRVCEDRVRGRRKRRVRCDHCA